MRSRSPLAIVASSLVLILAALAGLGATIIVDDDGSTPGLQAALDSTSPGDTVLVRPGHHAGSFTVPAGVRLLGSGPSLTTIDAEGGVWAVGLFTGASVEGFTLTGGRAGVEGVGGNSVIGNVIRNNGVPFDGRGGGRFIACGLLVEGNVIKDNNSFLDGGGLFIFIFNSSSCPPGAGLPLITNNILEENTAAGRGGAIFVEDAESSTAGDKWPTITHNTIVGNSASRGSLYLYNNYTPYGTPPPGTVSQITSNVIAGNSGGGAINFVAYGDGSYSYGLEFSDNIFFNNGVPELQSLQPLGTAGNVFTDPLFEDAPSGDYRLRADSPAIDAVGSAALFPARDVRGLPRPIDGDLDGTSLADLGALENSGEILNLTFPSDAQTLSWQFRAGSSATNLYRGDLNLLRAGGDHTQNPGLVPEALQWCGLTTISSVDLEVPELGAPYFYLAVPVGGVEGGLGYTSLLQPRPNAHPCP